MRKLRINNPEFRIKNFLSFLIPIVLIASVFFVYPPKQAKAGGSFYLSPGSQSVYQGSTFYVSVRVNTSGSSVDAVQANLSYPADKLDFLGVSYGGSGFEIQAESGGGGGSVRMGRGTLSAKSGDQLIGTVTFRAKVSSGSASVAFSGGTQAVKAGSTVTSATSGATYTFSEVPPPAKPKPKDKTAPKISSIEVSGVSLNTATVTWKTNEKANSTVYYGPTKNLGITAYNIDLVTTHKVILSNKLLVPGTRFYYQVRSKDAAGNEARSEVASFSTKGYSVRLKILDESGDLLSEVKVKLLPEGLEATTDENGIATFEDVAYGKHAVNIEVGGVVLGSEIEVEENKSGDEPQEFEVRVAGAAAISKPTDLLDKSNWPLVGLVGAVGIIIIFGSGLVWLWRTNRLQIRLNK